MTRPRHPTWSGERPGRGRRCGVAAYLVESPPGARAASPLAGPAADPAGGRGDEGDADHQDREGDQDELGADAGDGRADGREWGQAGRLGHRREVLAEAGDRDAEAVEALAVGVPADGIGADREGAAEVLR